MGGEFGRCGGLLAADLFGRNWLGLRGIYTGIQMLEDLAQCLNLSHES